MHSHVCSSLSSTPRNLTGNRLTALDMGIFAGMASLKTMYGKESVSNWRAEPAFPSHPPPSPPLNSVVTYGETLSG